MIKKKYIIFFFALSVSSCVTLRKADENQHKIKALPDNKELLSGKFRVNSIVNKDSIKGDLYWNIFDRGYNKFSTIELIEIELDENDNLLVNHIDGDSLIKSKLFKGKYKNGYFKLRRKWLIIPGIYVNLYRNRVFRIGILDNGNLITDYRQITLGTAVFIVPFGEIKKEFNIEFERITE